MNRRTSPVNDHERLLLETLEQERAATLPKVSLGRYTGIADYLLREAQFFDAPHRTDDDPIALPGYCYVNAYRFARNSKGDLRYAEGYALAHSGMPHLPAWCVDLADRVVDSIWHGGSKSAIGLAYLGNVFELDHVAKVRRGPIKSPSVINDWRRGFPLFK